MISENSKPLEALKASLPANVRPQFEKKLEMALKELDEKKEDWTLTMEKNGLQFYSKKDPVFIIQRSETDIDLPISTLIPYLQDTEFRKKYDNLLESYETAKQLSPNVQLIRSQIKGKFMVVSPRDFVTYRVFGFIDDKVG